jgi:cell division transport system permease protein
MNVYKNKLMSIASICIISASLILFGIFIIVTSNIEYNSRKTLETQPEMQVYCDYSLDDFQISQIYDELKKNPNVETCSIVSKQEAFKKTKALFGDDGTLLNDMGDDFLPVSFIIKLKNTQESDSIAEDFRKIPGVSNVAYSQKTVYVISTITKWIKIFSGLLMLVFSIFSIFIIANTVRLAMLSRKKEISIMKYVGATDAFIRWPFIIEGIIIGLIGSAIGLVIVTMTYRFALDKYLTELDSIFSFIDAQIIAQEIIVIYLIIGVAVGALGSAISIRKYLRV